MSALLRLHPRPRLRCLGLLFVLKRTVVAAATLKDTPLRPEATNPLPALRHDSILTTIGSTPVIKLSRLAPEGVEVYVKCEAYNPMGSVKDRLALEHGISLWG